MYYFVLYTFGNNQSKNDNVKETCVVSDLAWVLKNNNFGIFDKLDTGEL